jgi:hypothetical protein
LEEQLEQLEEKKLEKLDSPAVHTLMVPFEKKLKELEED